MKRTLTIVSLTAVAATSLLVGGLRVAQGQTAKSANQPEKFPDIHRAMFFLERARAELENPTNNFGPDRKTAIESCDRTLLQLKLVLRYEQDPSGKAGKL
jgi:hypothetical protein